MIETIEQLLTADSPAVFLEGESGSGRKTLCAQFIAAYPKQCFYLFVKPASKLAYHPDYLRELLAEQFLRWLTGETQSGDPVDVSEYASLLLKVRKKARSTALFIIVDGLDDIPREDQRLVEQIFRDVLPIGVDPFRFLIAADAESNSVYLKKTKAKTFQAIRLSPTESEVLLTDVCEDAELRAQLEKLCQGNPGRIWSARRLLQSGVSPSDIVRAEPAGFLEFVKLEFARLDELEDPQKEVLAALAFGRQEFAVGDLSRVCKVTIASTKELIESCIFLRINEQTDAVEFLSETHRLYATKKLETFSKQAIALQIEFLKADPFSATAVRMLPNYYQQARNQLAIVELLSPDHYRKLLEVTQSISALRLRAALGARSAQEINEVASVFRFALQSSIFSAIGEVSQSESEVEALVALGEPQRALEIAAQATAKESRLGMLAAYGRQVVENGGVVDAQTIDFIRETAEQIDFSELGDQASEIAANLVFVDADLAFKIIESSSTSRGQDAKDAAYAKISVAAMVRNSAPSDGVLKAAREKVSDKGLQLMLGSMALLAEKFTFEEVRRAAEAMEPGRRIQFLRSLALAGAGRSDALDVVEFALDQIVGETGYVPKPKDLSDLAYPLTKESHSSERRAKLVRRIVAQLALVGRVSTSTETVKVQLRLAHAEYILGEQGASGRVIDTYYEVTSIENLEVRVECLALMLNALMTIDKSGELEKKDGLKAVIADDLQKGLDTLLQRTAEHFEVARSSIRAITRVNAGDGYALATRLNTLNRRERAYAEIVSSLPAEEFSGERERVLFLALNSIESPELRDAAFAGACQAVIGKVGSGEWSSALTGALGTLRSPDAVSECALILLKACGPSPSPDAAVSLEKCVVEAVEKLDSPLDQADSLFALCSLVAKVDVARAAVYYDKARDIRAGLALGSDSAVDILNACLSLLSRANKSLAKHGLLAEDLVRRFARLVEMMPGTFSKCAVFADLAARVWCEGKTELSCELAKQYCVPLLDSIEEEDKSLRADMAYVCFPVLYLTHRALAVRILEALSANQRESAISLCLRMVIRRTSPGDPYPPSDDGPPSIAYSDALEAMELLKLTSVDTYVYQGIAEIVKALLHPDNRTRVSGTQRRDISSKLAEIVLAKLPDPRSISHDGYVIVARAQLGRLNDEKRAFWTALLRQADSIPNVADRAFVVMELSECFPGKLADLKREALEIAIRLIAEIPSGFDRFGRLEYYVEIVRGTSVNAAKEALKQAIQLTYSMPQRDQVSKCRRELADLADSIEPGLAEKLIDVTDEDPARNVVRREMRQFADVQKVRRQISKPGEKIGDEALSVRNLPVAAWKNVGALVAGRLLTQQPQDMLSFVSASGGFGLQDATPVLAWFLENCGRRFNSTPAASKFTLPLAEALLVSAELGVEVIAQMQARKLRVSASGDEAPGMLVRHKGREDAMAFIASWLRSSAKERVLLCDPYFGPGEVEFLGMFLKEAHRDCRLIVITSKTTTNFEQEVFEQAWRRKFDQDPPNVEVITVGGLQGTGILHDRWLVSEVGGLRIGTSLNSIGRGKLSEISVLEPGRDREILNQLDMYAARTKMVDGQRLQYVSFQL